MSKRYLKYYEAIQLDPRLDSLSDKIQDLIMEDELHLTKDAYETILKEVARIAED